MWKNKKITVMKKTALFLSFFCTVAIYAQQESEVRNNILIGTSDDHGYLNIKKRPIVPEKSIVLNVGYNFPFIRNTSNNGEFWDKVKKNGIEFSLDYKKHFHKKEITDEQVLSTPQSFAVGVGLGISYFSQSARFENFSETFNYIDVDKDQCKINLDFQNVKESISLTYLDVPLYVEIGKLGQTKTSASLKLGFKASLLISEKFSGAGTYTSTGYYPELDVVLHDVPVLNYYTNSLCYNNPEYKLSPFVLWGTVAAGINFPFSSIDKNILSAWILRVGAKMDYSLTPVSKSLPTAPFAISKYRINQSNIFGSDGSEIFSIGLSLGLLYCF